MDARELFEYGEANEGYWTSDKFMKQVSRVVEIAEVTLRKKAGNKFGFLTTAATMLQC